MKEKSKRSSILGFTLVELVIVIAVIAILAAVLIPTFSSVISSANNSADLQLVTNMNTVINTVLDDNEKGMAQDLRKILKENGIDDIATKKSGNIIVFDKRSKQFEILKLSNVEKANVISAVPSMIGSVYAASDEIELTTDGYSGEEIIKDKIIVSTSGDYISEAIYKMHNLKSTVTNEEVKGILDSIKDEKIKKAVVDMVNKCAYLTTDGNVINITASIDESSGELTVNVDKSGAGSKATRLVFPEDTTELDLSKLGNGCQLGAIIPSTVKEIKGTLPSDSQVVFSGNVNAISDEAKAANAKTVVVDEDVERAKGNILAEEEKKTLDFYFEDVFYVCNDPESEVMNYGGDVAKALSDAATAHEITGQDKVVLLNGSATLDEDATIVEGVTLLLPYDGKSTDAINKTTTATTSSYGAAGKCSVTFTINDNVVLTNNGTITIGGVTTGQQGGQSGCTADAYAEIMLSSNAKINSYGDINSYGFITEATKDNGSQVIMNSGSFLMPFVVVEHRGGSAFAAIYTGGLKGAPFNRYYMENCTALLTIKSAAHLLGHANLFAIQDNETDIKLAGAGSDEMIQLQGNSYFTMNVDRGTKVADIEIYGSFVLNPLTITVVSYPVSMDKTYFPFSYLQQITLLPNGDDEAIVNCTQQNIKLFPGAKIEIKKNVTVNAKNIVIYTGDYVDKNTYGSTATWNYPTADKGNGQLIIGGTLIADEIGGPVIANGSGAILTVKNSNTVMSYEVETVKAFSFLSSCTWSEYENKLTGSIYQQEGKVDNQELSTGTYTSKDGAWIREEE